MLYVVMAYIIMGLYSYDRNSFGPIYSYGLYSYGLYSYGLYSSGLYIAMAYIALAYVVMAYIVMAYIVMACNRSTSDSCAAISASLRARRSPPTSTATCSCSTRTVLPGCCRASTFFLATSRHRRRHVHCADVGVLVLKMTACLCAGMGVPVLKMTASPRRSF